MSQYPQEPSDPGAYQQGGAPQQPQVQKRSFIPLVLGAVIVAALVALLVFALTSGDDDGSITPGTPAPTSPDTGAPATTVSPTTSPATTAGP